MKLSVGTACGFFSGLVTSLKDAGFPFKEMKGKTVFFSKDLNRRLEFKSRNGSYEAAFGKGFDDLLPKTRSDFGKARSIQTPKQLHAVIARMH